MWVDVCAYVCVSQEGMLATSVDNLLARVLPGVEASLRDGLFSRLFLSHLVNDIDERGLLRRASEQVLLSTLSC